MKAVAASAGDDLNDCAIVAAPEVMYDERKKNLDEFINEAGKATRGYIPRSRNVFSVTKEGFVGGTVPTKGAEVGIGTGGKIDAAVICGYKLYIVRTNCVSLSVVVTHNWTVINALDTALIGFLADEAVIAILASISNTKDTAIKRRVLLN
jgi:hypothetical protein